MNERIPSEKLTPLEIDEFYDRFFKPAMSKLIQEDTTNWLYPWEYAE